MQRLVVLVAVSSCSSCLGVGFAVLSGGLAAATAQEDFREGAHRHAAYRRESAATAAFLRQRYNEAEHREQAAKAALEQVSPSLAPASPPPLVAAEPPRTPLRRRTSPQP